MTSKESNYGSDSETESQLVGSQDYDVTFGEDVLDNLREEVETAIKELGLAAEGLNGAFSVGGSKPANRPIKLCFREDGNPFIEFNMPAQSTDQAILDKLVAACSAATFGNMKEQADVLDPSYRSALKLEPDSFYWSLEVAELGILPEIARVLAPNAAGLRAERYKLNVHRAGDFFKEHVDTPRGDDMVGSLVIALPTAQMGGALTVKHQDQSVRFDWSLPEAGLPDVGIRWAAFCSDCKHEVEKVESGHRITITYNLYALPYTQPPLKVSDASSMPLHNALATATANPELLPEGGYLAFICQHAYPHSSKAATKMFPSHLKGADASLFTVAQSQGLNVHVKPVYPSGSYNYTVGKRFCPPQGGVNYNGDWCIGDTWVDYERKICSFGQDEFYSLDNLEQALHLSDRVAPMDKSKIIWCSYGAKHRELGEFLGIYGNNYSVNHYYSYATIFIELPPTAQRDVRTVPGIEDKAADSTSRGGSAPPNGGQKRKSSSDE